MFPLRSRRLGIAFLSLPHLGDRQNGFQHCFFVQPWAYTPRCSFSNYIQKDIHSKGMALAMVQKDSAHTQNINIFCFHWRVESLVLHFCLPPIPVADNMASIMAHTMVFPTSPELINPDAAFLITHRRKSIPKGWLWQDYKGIQLTRRTAIHSVSIGE